MRKPDVSLVGEDSKIHFGRLGSGSRSNSVVAEVIESCAYTAGTKRNNKATRMGACYTTPESVRIGA